MKTHIVPAIRLTLFCALFFSGIYTMSILGIAQLAPNQGKGFITENKGKRYHTNVGQAFTQNKYFWSRPSAVDYNAAGSGGSNKGPSNPEYLATVESRIDTFLLKNPGVARKDVPAELVTASGAGLDPDISPEAAAIQTARVAKARNLTEATVTKVIEDNTEKPLLGCMGPAKVNVLKLNLAIDNLQ
ncbi:K(+)-transporting ATPase subunit C [Flavobacterium sp. RHBU_3]|uniref:K(+)-transporting ATPase subunit C n=1 Tax=Flavobacterium sp. RHBU_3 TaxID=3391184 RepID=UPI003984664A